MCRLRVIPCLIATVFLAASCAVSASASKVTLSVTTQTPINGQTVSGSVPWQVNVSPTPTRVDFAVDGAVKWSQTASPFTYGGAGGTLDTTKLSNGAHTLAATAYDAKGSKSTSQITVTVANAAPAPALTPAPTSTAASALHWAMARSSLNNISNADAAQASRDFDTPNTLIQNSSPLSANPVPSGWSSIPTDRWGSYAQFAADVQKGPVPSYVKVVQYDNEAWSQTPTIEQQNPSYYEQQFCALAHSHGWLCFTGPGKDLCSVLPHPSGKTNAQCYIDLNLAGNAARYADIVDIQAQSLEPAGASAYASFLQTTAGQARAANPDVLVLGNISPSPNGIAISAQQMYACATAALPYVSGFYTTVSSSDGATMVSFLQLLDS